MPSFEDHINGNKPVVVDFFAEWCGPCKMMPPILSQVKQSVGDNATILKLDIDKNPHYAQKFGIQSVPTLMIFKNGNVVWRTSGVTPAHQILQQLKGQGVNVH